MHNAAVRGYRGISGPTKQISSPLLAKQHKYPHLTLLRRAVQTKVGMDAGNVLERQKSKSTLQVFTLIKIKFVGDILLT